MDEETRKQRVAILEEMVRAFKNRAVAHRVEAEYSLKAAERLEAQAVRCCKTIAMLEEVCNG